MNEQHPGITMFLESGGYLHSERSWFTASLIDGVICVVDIGGEGDEFMTVTNDIETVCARVSEKFGTGHLMIYRDSDGIWDQVVMTDAGTFAAFRAIRTVDMVDALNVIGRRADT